MGPSTTTSTPAAGAGAILVSEEYRNLVDKSFSKFSRLREFPLYGRNKWDSYYHKAFQVYSKLWKFQQENREELMRTGLKRWEIGEIASRIGQLYYNYYLRTSDAKFLTESKMFYEAIMTREYFKDTGKDTSLANKHLRFYARFIVVCLLLNQRETVRKLVAQFDRLVQDYAHLFQGNDGKEWKLVVHEITRFMKADACCESGRPLRYSISLDPHPLDLPEITSPDVGKLQLQDAILASYYHNEVKFNELTLDTFRMLQSLEWEPSGMLYKAKSTESFSNGSMGALSGPSLASKGNLHLEIPDPTLPANPHKYILYRPTVSSLLLVLATACEELSPESILLLYISAAGNPFAGKPPRSSQAGSISTSSASGSEVNLLSPTENVHKSGKHSSESIQAASVMAQNGTLSGSSCQMSSRQNSGNYITLDSHHSGGLWLGSKRSTGVNHLFPSDLLPFTRRPLLIVIDSDNSSAFEVISGHERGEPAALLLSPTLQVVDEKGPSGASSSAHSGGNLFTFFLTAPVPAFCRIVGVSSTSQPLKLQPGILDELEKIVADVSLKFGESLAASPSIDPTWARILGDPILRQMVFRFVLCRATFSLHTLYHNRQEYIPRCLPKLPEEASPSHRIVEQGVFQIANLLGVVDQFIFSPATPSPSRSNGELKWKGKSPPKSKVSKADSLQDERSGSSGVASP